MILDSIREKFGWAYGSYWEVDPRENALKFVAESGQVGEEFRRATMETTQTAAGRWTRPPSSDANHPSNPC
jgi:hypothetical protein